MQVSVQSGFPVWQCPTHHSPLRPEGGSLRCSGNHAFKIDGDIPRFVDSYGYAAPFGIQWKQYRLTQLDSYTGIPISETRLRACLGEELWNALPGLQVLECGCGAGRFTEILLARRAWLTSIDLSDAVEATWANFGEAENLRVAQANVLSLPFAPQQFDVVVALGLIMHTPNPETTMAKLWEQVKPGGYLVIDHYSFSRIKYFITSSVPLWRAVLKRLPREMALRFTDRLVDAVYPLQRSLRNRPFLSSLLFRMVPVHTYFNAYPALDDRQQYEWARLDTHNALTGWYKHSRTEQEIRSYLQALGAVNLQCWKGGNGVQARAQRPAS